MSCERCGKKLFLLFHFNHSEYCMNCFRIVKREDNLKKEIDGSKNTRQEILN